MKEVEIRRKDIRKETGESSILNEMPASKRETLFRPLILEKDALDTKQEKHTYPEGYSEKYITHHILTDGTRVTFCPALPDDASSMTAFYDKLSDETVYRRWNGGRNRKAHLQLLQKACSIDYNQGMTLVMRTEQKEIVGVGQLIKLLDRENEAEGAIVIADQFQKKGLGNKLLYQLIAIGRDQGLKRIIAGVNFENTVMQEMLWKRSVKWRRTADFLRFEIDPRQRLCSSL